MFEFLAFCALFGLFMLRARMFDWKSIVSADWDEEIHGLTFVLFSLVSFIVLIIVMLCRTDAEKRLKKEYDGVYVTPAEFRAGVGRAELGEAKFSKDVKCEEDAD